MQNVRKNVYAFFPRNRYFFFTWKVFSFARNAIAYAMILRNRRRNRQQLRWRSVAEGNWLYHRKIPVCYATDERCYRPPAHVFPRLSLLVYGESWFRGVGRETWSFFIIYFSYTSWLIIIITTSFGLTWLRRKHDDNNYIKYFYNFFHGA